ncbi:MAG: PilZ domain-containing protein [Phycisphaerae bacterium]
MALHLTTCWSLLAEWSPVDNYSATRKSFGPGVTTELLYWIVICLLAITMALITTHIIRRQLAASKKWKAFLDEARQLDLEEDEMDVLVSMTKIARASSPAAALHSATSFDRLQKRMEESRDFANLTEARQVEIHDIFDSLRGKLGFPSSEASRRDPVSSREIARGTYLTICPGQGVAPVEVVLAENTSQVLVVEPLADMVVEDIEVGKSYACLFNHDGSYWQFMGLIRAMANGDIYIAHSHELAKADRRRYPRIPTMASARIAAYHFVTRGKTATEGPEYHDAKLIEIAGPGLLIETDLTVNAGQKVLVTIEMGPDHYVESMGIVRRADNSRGSVNQLGVELVGLNGSELGLLLKETRNAQVEDETLRRYKRKQADLSGRIALCDLVKPNNKGGSLNYVDANVVDIGGPGLLVVSALKADADKRVMVCLNVGGQKVIESMAMVRRCEATADNKWKLGVEMIGLSRKELKVLVEEVAKAERSAAAGANL